MRRADLIDPDEMTGITGPYIGQLPPEERSAKKSISWKHYRKSRGNGERAGRANPEGERPA